MREATPNLTGLPQPGDLFAGKFRIVRVIGVGGMGVVLEAHHMHLDQRVAIKMLLPELANNPDLVQRFVREGRAAVKIPGEHVARVLDVGTLPDGDPFMVMELLEGADLQGVLDARGPLPVALAVDYILQTCEALAHAHRMGIVHRDLKPPNLFITGPDNAPVVKLLDFGISKLPAGGSGDLSVTKTSAVMGSPLYMAPEQMRSARRVDARADIWGLGILLYTMLTGRPPFDSESMPEVCAMIVQDPTPSLVEKRAGVPPELARAVERCLEKDPGRRFASVAELARALAPFASEQGRAMIPRIEATAPAVPPVAHTEAGTSGTSGTAPLPTVARTGSSWGGHALPMPGRNRRLVWVAGAAGALAVVTSAFLLGARRGHSAAAAGVTPAAGSSLAAEPPAPSPSATGAALVALPAPSPPATSPPATPSTSLAAAPRSRIPSRAAHPSPARSSAPSPPPAAPTASDTTPPGWTSGRKD